MFHIVLGIFKDADYESELNKKIIKYEIAVSIWPTKILFVTIKCEIGVPDIIDYYELDFITQKFKTTDPI